MSCATVQHRSRRKTKRWLPRLRRLSSMRSLDWCRTPGSRTGWSFPRTTCAPRAHDTFASGSTRPARSSGRRLVPAEYTYDYAIVRVVPRVDRGEQVNVGIILSWPDANYLDALIEVNDALLLALDPQLDVAAV